MKTIILRTVAWYVVAALSVVFVVRLDLTWNFFSWRPSASLDAFGSIVGLLGALFSQLALERKIENGWEGSIICLGCLILLFLGIQLSLPEKLSDEFLGRDVISPLWYRFGILTILSIPLLFLLIRTWQKRKGRLNQAALATSGSTPR